MAPGTIIFQTLIKVLTCYEYYIGDVVASGPRDPEFKSGISHNDPAGCTAGSLCNNVENLRVLRLKKKTFECFYHWYSVPGAGEPLWAPYSDPEGCAVLRPGEPAQVHVRGTGPHQAGPARQVGHTWATTRGQIRSTRGALQSAEPLVGTAVLLIRAICGTP